MKPRVLVLRTAGTNCDKETEFAFKSSGAVTELLHINHVKREKSLGRFQIIALPGGFSYGDDLGAGKIFSLELLLWLKDALKKFVDKGGLMIGICNGFQIMVKTGILPDADFVQQVTLSDNDSGRFEDRWIYLRRATNDQRPAANIWLKGLPEVIAMPVAHGEGKFIAPVAVLKRIEKNHQVAFRYCDHNGKSAAYPYNPNASLNDIAGITDASGRVLGLMPHPERAMFRHQLPDWQDKRSMAWGKKIFDNAVSYFR